MRRIGYVYKLFCDGIEDFYIGSTFNMRSRKYEHKHNCNNPNSKDYNLKVYQYIRANKGFDNWKFEILVEKDFENKTALKIKEKDCIKLLNSTLNMCSAYRTDEEFNLYTKANNVKRLAEKINCACGSTTNKHNKARHEKSKNHQKYLKTINNINNITYNITNLHIHN